MPRPLGAARRKTPCVSYRIADEPALAAATALLADRYASRGYGDHLIPAGEAYTTFVAELDRAIVATVTLELRGAEAWLVRLASSARLAAVLAGLFDLAYAHGTAIGGAVELYMDVRPSHEMFYKKAFGFEPVGPLKAFESLGVSGQTIRIDVGRISPTGRLGRRGRDRHRPGTGAPIRGAASRLEG